MTSSDMKISTGTGYHFESNGSAVHCPANANNAILNGSKKEELDEKYSLNSKRYNSMREYCNEVADKLPQRQAFYTFDFADVLWKVQEWKKSLPSVEIFYAVKANTDPVLLQLLQKLGLSFDCASSGEIEMVLNAGASPSDIIFAHTIKAVDELKYASEKCVDLMTFDSEDELLKIHRLYPNARLVIRISPTNVSCIFDLSDKFGCSEEEAIYLLKMAKQLDLTVVGISFHVGALCNDPESYTSTIRTCRHLFDKAQEIGFSFSILDIGGGFYGQSGTEDIFYKMADGINEPLKKYFNDSKVRVIAEPGTYIVGSASNLVCTVLGRRCFQKAEDGHPKKYYYVNNGVYGSFFKDVEQYGIRPIPLLPESEFQSRTKYNSRIFGQTCCSEDVIQLNVILPDLKVGERVMWENMGSYTRGVCSTFCGVPLPVPRYMFVQNPRLSMDWMEDKKNIQIFLNKHVVFIDSEANDTR